MEQKILNHKHKIISFFILDLFKKSHSIQSITFEAKNPCTSPPQNVPATFQQQRPPFFPFRVLSVDAGQIHSL